MGPSGSGKTTFLNIAGLLDTFDQGTYRLDGQDVARLSDRRLSRLRNEKIGFIFQSFNLIPDLDVFDNIDVPLRYRGLAAGERARAHRGGAGGGRPDRALRHLPGAALRRPAAAGGDRARAGRQAAADPRRRAHRQPRLGDGHEIMDLLERINGEPAPPW